MLTALFGLIRRLGHWQIRWTQGVGRSAFLLMSFVWRLPETLWRLSALVQQLYVLGVLSLPIMLVSGVAVGMVLALQGHYVLARFGSAEMVGALSGLSLIRELGPVLAGLLFVGRAGSALTAELGLMKATDQLSALEMMAINPVGRIYAPRFWAGFIAMPMMMLLFTTAGILGSYYVSVSFLHVDAGAFWGHIQGNVVWDEDVIKSLIKSLVFGWFVMWIAVFQGVDATPTATGISRATTKTVVLGSLMILMLDFLLTSMMFV